MLPDRCAVVGARVPIGGILSPLEEADFAAAALEDPGFLHGVHAGGFGAGQHVGFAKDVFCPAVLLEPVEAELGVGIKIVLGEEAIDELKDHKNPRHCRHTLLDKIVSPDPNTGKSTGANFLMLLQSMSVG